MRYFIYLSYNGKEYVGWQRQPNGISVQQRLEESLSTILREEISVVGAGRTDAGVHARLMVAHVDLAEPLEDPAALAGKLNRLLPKDIAIRKIVPVTDDAHARFSATARTYRYYLCTEKDPFLYEFSYRVHAMPNVEAMNKACQILFEYTDFTSFSKLHTDVKTNNCTITQAEWVREGDSRLVFTITADRFLRNMVRAIVGTLLEVGSGKLSIDGFRRVIEQKDRCRAGNSVPGHALFLEHVEYPDTLFLS